MAAAACWPPGSASYTLHEHLGSGTFGVVYLARRRTRFEKRSEQVAIKIVPRYSHQRSRELEMMLALTSHPHPSVMPLHEFFFCKLSTSSARCHKNYDP